MCCPIIVSSTQCTPLWLKTELSIKAWLWQLILHDTHKSDNRTVKHYTRVRADTTLLERVHLICYIDIHQIVSCFNLSSLRTCHYWSGIQWQWHVGLREWHYTAVDSESVTLDDIGRSRDSNLGSTWAKTREDVAHQCHTYVSTVQYNNRFRYACTYSGNLFLIW